MLIINDVINLIYALQLWIKGLSKYFVMMLYLIQ